MTVQNNIIQHAAPLLCKMAHIRQSQNALCIETLQQWFSDKIKAFEHALKEKKCPQKPFLAARYLICTALDETILSTTWGQQSNWTQNSLLQTFHHESNGGERFYIIIQHMLKHPKDYKEVLELAYHLLSLGFEGQLYNAPQTQKESFRDKIFYQLSLYQPVTPQTFHHIHTLTTTPEATKVPFIRRHKYMLMLLSLYVALNLALYLHARPIFKQLNEIQFNPINVFSKVIDRPLIAHDFKSFNQVQK